MRISEVFSSIYPYERSMDGGYFQDSEGTTISVLFDEMATGIWAVAFQRGVIFSMTGSGDQFKILATVVAIIKEWASQAKPDIITFSSNKEDHGRTSAYGAMVKRLIKDTDYVNVTDNIRVVKDEKQRDWLERAKRHYGSSDIFVLARRDQIT